MFWSRWLWMLGHASKGCVTELSSFPSGWKKNNKQNKLPLPFVHIWISHFLLQLEMCLLPYSNPSVCFSEYISSYSFTCHFLILIFNLLFSLAVCIQTSSNISYLFLKGGDVLTTFISLSTSSPPFLLSLNPPSKLLDNVWRIPLSQFFSQCYADQLPTRLFSDILAWPIFAGAAQPGHHLPPVLTTWPPTKQLNAPFLVVCIYRLWRDLLFLSMDAFNSTFINLQLKLSTKRPKWVANKWVLINSKVLSSECCSIYYEIV